jgi:hypothetical protein
MPHGTESSILPARRKRRRSSVTRDHQTVVTCRSHGHTVGCFDPEDGEKRELRKTKRSTGYLHRNRMILWRTSSYRHRIPQYVTVYRNSRAPAAQPRHLSILYTAVCQYCTLQGRAAIRMTFLSGSALHVLVTLSPTRC